MGIGGSKSEAMEASLNFWRGIAQNSILTIDKNIDLENLRRFRVSFFVVQSGRQLDYALRIP